MFGRSATPAEAEVYVRQALPRLLARARALTMNQHDAEDLVQETLVKVLLHWNRVDSAGAVDPYVRQIMVNTFISGRRKRASREVVSHDLVVNAEESREAELSPAHGDLWPLVAALPRQQRAVLVLRYYEDLSDEQIADVLGISPGTVRSNAHRALAAIRPAVEPVR